MLIRTKSRDILKSTYGYQVYTGVGEDGFIQCLTVTAFDVHQSLERDTLLLGDEVALYVDAAYRSKEAHDKLELVDIANRVQHTGYPLAVRT